MLSLESRPAVDVYAEMVSAPAQISVMPLTLADVNPASPLGQVMPGRQSFLPHIVEVTDQGWLPLDSPVNVGSAMQIFSSDPVGFLPAYEESPASKRALGKWQEAIVVGFVGVDRSDVQGADVGAELRLLGQCDNLAGARAPFQLQFMGSGFPLIQSNTVTIGRVGACNVKGEH